MKLSKKFIAVPALALAAGISLAACGSSPNASVANPTQVTPAPTTPAPTTAAPTTPAPAQTIIVQPAPAPVVVQPAPAPVYVAPANTGGNCGGGVNAGPNTSCAFALNVAAAYHGPGGDAENVYSPVTGQTYYMVYGESNGVVVAHGGNDASVDFYG